MKKKSRDLENKTRVVLDELEEVNTAMSDTLELLDFAERGLDKRRTERDDASSRLDKSLGNKRKREETILSEVR